MTRSSARITPAVSLVAGVGLVAGSLLPMAPAHAAPASWVSQPDSWAAVATQSRGANGQSAGRVHVAMVKTGGTGVGTKVAIGGFPEHTRLLDQSNDGRRLLLVHTAPGSQRSKITVRDTVTRVSSNWYLKAVTAAKFTNPGGQAVLTASESSTSWQRRALANGALQATYAGANAGYSAVQDPAGRWLVGRSGKQVTVSANASGVVVRRTTAPGECQVQFAFNASSVTLGCVATSTSVWQYTITNGGLKNLTGALPRSTYGYLVARPTPAGLAVAKTVSCGAAQWGWATPTTWKAMPKTGEDRAVVALQAGGSRALVLVGGCGENVRLDSQTTKTGASVALAGGRTSVVVGVATADRLN